MHVQFYFRSSANFSGAFWPPGAGPSPVQVADNFLFRCEKTQKKTFCLLFILILIFCFTFTTCELCLYFLNWVFPLKMSSKQSTYTESAAMTASRWGSADREKPTFKDFQCQGGDRNVSDAEANRNKYCAIIPNP